MTLVLLIFCINELVFYKILIINFLVVDERTIHNLKNLSKSFMSIYINGKAYSDKGTESFFEGDSDRRSAMETFHNSVGAKY